MEEVSADQRPFGIEVLDLHLPVLILPEENRFAIERRMRTVLDEEARLYKARHDRDRREFEKRKAEARRDILADADKQAEIIRLKTKVQADAIYENALRRMTDVNAQ